VHVTAEEDRARAAEHGEQGDEHVVERIDRGQDHEDQEQARGSRVEHAARGEQSLGDGHTEHEHGAEPDDDRDIEQDRPDEAWVIARLLIPREELSRPRCRPSVMKTWPTPAMANARANAPNSVWLRCRAISAWLMRLIPIETIRPTSRSVDPRTWAAPSVTPQDPGDTLRSRSR
jgi:hypothetical protein